MDEFRWLHSEFGLKYHAYPADTKFADAPVISACGQEPARRKRWRDSVPLRILRDESAACGRCLKVVRRIERERAESVS